METQDRPFAEICIKLHHKFFEQFPDTIYRGMVSRALAMLLECQQNFPGEPGAWAGGIAYAVGHNRYGVPGVLNAQLEDIFTAKMPAIRKRATQIKQMLGDDAPLYIPDLPVLSEFVRQNFSITTAPVGTGR